jgi:hypothetical protein
VRIREGELLVCILLDQLRGLDKFAGIEGTDRKARQYIEEV